MNVQRSSVRSQYVDFSEPDLKKLQWQYREVKGAKQAYIERTRVIINRDEQEIQRLLDEREELSRSLKVFQKCFNPKTEACVVRDLSATLASGDGVHRELEAEKGKLASLKYQILEWERKLAELRTIRGTTPEKSDKSDNSKLLKITQHMENKLFRACQCLSTLITRNGDLREELCTLKMEKRQFLRVKSLLEKELLEIQMNISSLLTKCTEAFNASVQNQEKERMLLNQNANSLDQFIKGKLILEQKISHYCNIEAFLDTKNAAQVNKNVVHRKENLRQWDSKELAQEDFEDVITKICSKTKEGDLDKLVWDFIQTEKQNDSLLNFINRQHSTRETVQRQISQICSEMDVFEVEEKRRQEKHRALQLSLSNQQEAIEQELAVHQKNVEFTENILDLVRKGLMSWLQNCYDSSGICGELGSSGVQNENITQCLGVVEDRVNELLTLQACLHSQNNLSQWDTAQPLGITPEAVKVTTAAVKPAPRYDPNLVDTVLLEAKEPMSREALQKLVNKRIQKTKTTD